MIVLATLYLLAAWVVPFIPNQPVSDPGESKNLGWPFHTKNQHRFNLGQTLLCKMTGNLQMPTDGAHRCVWWFVSFILTKYMKMISHISSK